MEKQVKVTEICPTKTQALIKNGALLIDVREKDEVAQLAYDVPNIINIPLSIFEEHYTEIPKDREVVMVCKSGGRSARASERLKELGFTTITDLEGGITNWNSENKPTVK